MNFQTIRACSVLSACCLAAGLASAQHAGDLVVRLGVTQIKPDVNSGDLSAPAFTGTKAAVGASTRPTAGVTWFWRDNISLDLPLALGFEHELTGDGAIAGMGKLGTAKVLPATLLVQYRFGAADARVRPYVGVGPTYARFYGERSTMALTGVTGGSPTTPTTLRVQSHWGLTGELGASVQLAPRWSLDVSVLKTKLKTRTQLSTGQHMDIALDPWSYSLSVGYSF
ncbi:OmpW family protein [Roseateles sp. BYS180W]|uniref:OmpW family protein n=1 Tax=Roseateles rivi TaxID=3299028 RepID=A0ABW7FZH5_9BURK